MITLLLIALAVLGFCFWRYRREQRATWRQVHAMLETINDGRRPPSFILHGEEPVWRVGLGLEQLADERDRMKRQISQEGFNIQAILSSMGEGVMIVDTSRMIRLVNASCQELFDLKEPPLGRSVLQALRNMAIDEAVALALREGSAQGREVALPLSGRRVKLNASPVRDSEGGTLGAAVIFHDITRMRQLEEVRREFVANVSHELRTPLSIFQGYLEMLVEHPDLPRKEVLTALNVLQKHSRRLNLLVEDLLSLARLEARQEQFFLEPMEVGRLLEEVALDWRLKFSERKVAFDVRQGAGLPRVNVDIQRMEQVMHNLLENALKYTPEGGEVVVEAVASPEGEVEIQVRDSGQGIAPDDLPHIFERFYRADKARSRSLGGTGLGLSIVKHLVQAQGGKVWATSQRSCGTTIFLRLPPLPVSEEEKAG